MTAPELKPCPFCGGEAEFSLGKTGDGKDWHYIECVNCGATGPLVNYADHNIAINDALADAWNRRADLAAVQPAQVRVKPLVFDWHKDEDSPNPSCWRAKGDGYHAYVLIPFDAGFDPAGGVGTWNANPNHRGRTGFKSREDAMAYCETSIRNQAEEDLRRAMRAIAIWGGEPQPDSRDEVIARLVDALVTVNGITEASFPQATSAGDVAEIQKVARAALAAAKVVQQKP